MVWAKSVGDPLLKTKQWAARKTYWRQQGELCSRCGGVIDYAAKWPHPLSLVVGHKVSRAKAKRAGWTEAMINSLDNTQPEHALCSKRSGIIEGNKSPVRKAKTIMVKNGVIIPVKLRESRPRKISPWYGDDR